MSATRRTDGDIICVGMMTYHGRTRDPQQQRAIYAHYLSGMTRFVRHLVQQGHQVRLVTGDRSDQEVVGDLCAALTGAESAAVEVCIAATLGELLMFISGTAAVVALRYHDIICGTKLALPTISISYAKKNNMLLADYGLGEYCQDVDTLDAELLVRQFEELCAQPDEHSARMAVVNERFRGALEVQYADVVTGPPPVAT